MRSPGITGGFHAEFSGGVARKEPSFENAATDHRASPCGHALIIKSRAAQGAAHMGFFDDVDVRGKHGGSQCIEQKTRASIECTATGGSDKTSEQPASQRRLKENGSLA